MYKVEASGEKTISQEEWKSYQRKLVIMIDEYEYPFIIPLLEKIISINIYSLPGQTSGSPTIQLKSIIAVIAYTIVSEFNNILSQLFIIIRASLINAGINERLVRLSIWNVAMPLVKNNRDYLHLT